MSYGVPESDSLTIAFICEPKRIQIVSAVLPAKPKNAPATTTLRNGAATAGYPGKVYYSKADEGFVFVAFTTAGPKVVGILKSGTALTIGIPGKQARVPLRGVAKPLAQFEAACFRKR